MKLLMKHPITLRHLSVLLAMSISSLLHGQSYQWSNFVGAPGGAGNVDGTGTAARFNYPRGIAVDASGNVFVADTSSHTIRKITKTGVVTTFAGSAGERGSADGTGANARFFRPQGIAVGSGGVLYVGDRNSTIRKITSAGVVTTLAGLAGQRGSVDGAGSAARFEYPAGIAVGADGVIYVSDSENNIIRKVTPAGVVTTIAGLAGEQGSADGTGTAARFSYPQGIAVDGSGNLFVADGSNCTIRKITPAGLVSTLAGTVGVFGGVDGTGTAAQFDYPSGVTLHNGDLYVASGYNGCVRKVTMAGVVTTFAGTIDAWGSLDGTGTAARFSNCSALTVDKAGVFYVADDENQNIRKITPAAVVTTLAGMVDNRGNSEGTGSDARFSIPQGIAVGATGEVYIADTYNLKIRKATAGGEVTTFAGSGIFGSANGPAASASFKFIYDAAADANGNLYVVDALSNVIRKIATDGEVSTFAGTVGAYGSSDGMGAAARFKTPTGIAVAADGTVYVADENDYTIRKITPAGEVTTLAGASGLSGFSNATGTAARFSRPQDVAVDAEGYVYVADYGSAVIRKISPAGVVTTLAGSNVAFGSADGTGGAARFNNPTGVAVDPYGNVIVCDTGNNTIRRITPAGVVTTIGGMAPHATAADGLGTASRFSQPWRVAISGTGIIYVVDKANNRIVKGVPLPEITVEEPVGADLKDGAAVSDFGVVSIHEDAVKTFTITSQGGAALTGLNLSITGTHAADFAVQTLGKTTLNPGQNMTLSVTFVGNVTGARTATLHITSNDTDESPFDITLKATAADMPVVTTAPVSQVAKEGDGVTFTAQASHPTATVKYQWLKNGAKIAGATGPTYQKNGLRVADAGTYTVEMTTNGATARRTATLVVAKYTEQTLLVKFGTSLKLTVNAKGPATYAWTKNNAPIAGTTATLNLPPLNAATGSGIYRCIVGGPGGGTVLAGVFTVNVFADKPQVVTPQNLPDSAVGSPYTHQIKVNTNTNLTPTSYAARGLPPGVTINTKTGLISGTPTLAKNYEITVIATNTIGSSSTKESITITPLHENLVGTFAGIVSRHPNLNDNLGGQVNLTITRTAAISGSLINGTKTHPFKGQLVTGGANPIASITVPRGTLPALTLNFALDTTSQTFIIGSRLRLGLLSTGVSGWRLKWKAVGAPATLSPKLFTFGIRPPTGMTGIPAGYGYGSFTLPASGLVNITGKTPDGTSFTHSTFVGPQGQIALFKTLHTPTGSLLGTLDIAPIDNGFLDQDVLEGSVSWSRTANAKSRYSPEGFGPIALTAFGGWHRLPDFAPGHVLNMLLDDKAMLTFREGGLSTASINPDVPTFDLLLGNKPSLPAALSAGNPGSVKITSLNAKAGTFTGTFILEDTELRTGPAFAGKKLKRTAEFSGVFTQDSMGPVGVGHFLLPEMPVDAMAPLPATTPTTTEILSGNLLFEKKM
jgi:sugar lactone lactonase YvrE